MKKMLKKMTMDLLAASMGCAMLTGCSGAEKGSSDADTIHMNDYVVIEEIGNNGHGTADARVDYDKIMEDYAEKFENIVETL